MRVKIDPFNLSPNAGFTHASTSWQLSKDLNFDIVGNILDQSLFDTINLTEYDSPAIYAGTVFVRVKLHFSDGSETSWSKVSVLSEEKSTVKYNSVIILTPKVDVTVTDSNYVNKHNITVTCTPFTVYNGPATHISTSWRITTSTGIVLFKREYDRENLTSINIDLDKEFSNQLYTVTVTYHTDVNINSNPGSRSFNTGDSDTMIRLLHQGVLFTEKYNLFYVETSLTGVITVAYKLVANDIDNTEIIPLTTINGKSFFINGALLDSDMTYSLTANVITDAGFKTSFKELHFTVMPADLGACTINPTKVYDNLFVSAGVVELFGEVACNTVEHDENVLILPRKLITDPNYPRLNRFKFDNANNLLIPFNTIDTLDFTNTDDLRRSNFLVLGEVIYGDCSSLNIGDPRIRTLMIYDKYTHLYTALPSPTMTLNKDIDLQVSGTLSCKVNNNLVATLTKDVSENVYINHIDIVSGITLLTLAIPAIITDPTICYMCDNEILILDNTTYALYKYDVTTNVFTSVYKSPAVGTYFTTNAKKFNLVLRDDKKVMFIVNNGGDGKDQYAVIYDKTLAGTDAAWTLTTGIIPDKKFTSTVMLSTGNILSIASDGTIIKYT